MGAPTHLIVGLGNPGADYRATRHNVGFRVIEELARRWGVAPRGAECNARLAARDGVLLALPQTYMNRSGYAVRCLVERYGIEPERVLVVLDEVALPLGKLRLRPAGSPGGHRGLESILESVQTDRRAPAAARREGRGGGAGRGGAGGLRARPLRPRRARRGRGDGDPRRRRGRALAPRGARIGDVALQRMSGAGAAALTAASRSVQLLGFAARRQSGMGVPSPPLCSAPTPSTFRRNGAVTRGPTGPQGGIQRCAGRTSWRSCSTPVSPTTSRSSLVDDVKKMITGSGAEIAKEESWGKRKLAYPIHKFSEGRYVFLYVIADGAAPPFQEVERRLNQNERVLRYLTIRTDEDLRRALRKGKRPPIAAEAVGMAPARSGPGGFDEVRRSDVEPRRSDGEPRRFDESRRSDGESRRFDSEPRRFDTGREN